MSNYTDKFNVGDVVIGDECFDLYEVFRITDFEQMQAFGSSWKVAKGEYICHVPRETIKYDFELSKVAKIVGCKDLFAEHFTNIVKVAEISEASETYVVANILQKPSKALVKAYETFESEAKKKEV